MRDTVIPLAVSLVVLASEGALLGLLHQRVLTPGSAAAGHAILVAGLALWAFLCARAGWDLRVPFLLAIGTTVLGPFAALGALCVLSLLPFYKGRAKTFEEWHASLFPSEELTSMEALVQSITRTTQDPESGQTAVTPFMDVLTSGSLDQKQVMISLIAKHFRPVLAPVLRLALNDPSNTIRVQAATAMAVIEEDFMKRTLGIEMAAMARPDHPETLKTLARHYDQYANTGILDEQRERDNQHKAIEAYRKYLGINPNDRDARLDVGRILLKSRSFTEATEWFELCLQDGFSTPEVILAYMESLFHVGRFRELRELARSHYAELTSREAYPPGVVETVKLWAHGLTSTRALETEGI